jgi:hypothetical protein
MHLILLVTIAFCSMDRLVIQWLYLGVSSCLGPHDAELPYNGASVNWNLMCASSQDIQDMSHLPEGSMEEWMHETHLREWEVWCLESLVFSEHLSVHEDDRMIKNNGAELCSLGSCHQAQEKTQVSSSRPQPCLPQRLQSCVMKKLSVPRAWKGDVT